MTLSLKNYKRLWTSIALFYFGAGYLACNWINNTRDHYHNIVLPFETDIPFIPLAVLVYPITYLCMGGIYFLAADKVFYKKFMRAFFFLTTLHYVLFLIIPVRMTLRPEILQDTGVLLSIVKIFYWMDLPYNCFPSLHIAYASLCLLSLWNYKRRWGYIYLLAVVAVSLSVVFVKQHYILDVLGGYLSALLVYLIFYKFKTRICSEH